MDPSICFRGDHTQRENLRTTHLAAHFMTLPVTLLKSFSCFQCWYMNAMMNLSSVITQDVLQQLELSSNFQSLKKSCSQSKLASQILLLPITSPSPKGLVIEALERCIGNFGRRLLVKPKKLLLRGARNFLEICGLTPKKPHNKKGGKNN